MSELNRDGRERGKQLVEKIYAAYAARQTPRHSRRIGHSWLGNECMRALFYKWRWCYEPTAFDGRMLRLFETGQLEEARFNRDLKSVGAVVHDSNPDKPSEQISVATHGGHHFGFLDAVAQYVPGAFDENAFCVVEQKTHNEKSFAKLEKEGVERAKPEHYVQMQGYMRDIGIDQALYMAKNKNTDHLYCEFVRRDERYGKHLEERARLLVSLTDLPDRIHSDPGFFKCKFCDAARVCHYGEPVTRNCRNCAHSTALDGDGKWWCELHGKRISTEQQEAGCNRHIYLPSLVPGEQIDASADENWIEYKLSNGEVWRDDHKRTDFRAAQRAGDGAGNSDTATWLYTNQKDSDAPAPLVSPGQAETPQG